MIFPTLYKTTKGGKEQEWTILVENHNDGTASYSTKYGQVDGEIQSTTVQIREGKNIGKSNETTCLQQAMSEATAKWSKQLDKGYSESRGGADMSLKPMLAHDYSKHKGKVSFPCYIQPKLDGCLSGDSLIKTKEYGYKTIKWIVDNKINCSVLSYNQSGRLEYKKIKYHFINKNIDEDIQWFEVELESGEKITVTGNHEVYLPDLKCWRRVDSLNGDENLMVI